MINKLIVAVAALAVAGAASAHTQLTDAQYLSAARCQALMGASSLGKMNTSDIDAALDKASVGRSLVVNQRADEVREDARRQAAHAGPQGKAALVSERENCVSAVHQGVMAAN